MNTHPQDPSDQPQSTPGSVPPPPVPNPEVAPYSQPGFQAGGEYAVDTGVGEPTTKGSKKKGLVIAGAAAGLVALGAGGWAIKTFVLDKVQGAESPEAAVSRLVESLESHDSIGAYGSIDPVDVELVGNSADRFLSHFDSLSEGELQGKLTDAWKAFDLTSKDVEYTVEDLGSGYARVFVEKGEFTLDADATKVSDLAVDSYNMLLDSGFGALIEETGTEKPTEDEIRAEVTESIEQEFPLTFTAEDLNAIPLDSADSLTSDLGGLSGLTDPFALEDGLEGLEGLGDDSAGLGEDGTEAVETIRFGFIATQSDSGWYVSPSVTAYDLQSRAMGVEPDYAALPAATPAASPEEAAANLVNGFTAGLKEGKLDGGLGLLVDGERRVATTQLGSDDAGDVASDIVEGMKQIDISDAEFELDRKEGDIAYLKLKSLKLSGEVEGQSGTVDISSECLGVNAAGMNISMCIRDIPAAQELGLDKVRLIAREVDGGWLIAGSESSSDASGILLSNVDRLAKEGKLTDTQWWIDNSGVLGQLLGSM
ncbi:hypothetical protein [Timonella senegalensis]|uniref:hypothetical protein n=1 Tax=Timonella senegalensis TaxID=1465825 RepID=UPI002FDCE5E2